MANEYLGRGWKFPVSIDPITGRIAMSEYVQDIRESIIIILSTAPGERVMRPDFGCGLHDFVFAPLNRATLGLIESRVRESILKFEPRVEIASLTIDTSASSGTETAKLNANTSQATHGQLNIDFRFRVRDTNNEFNLVFPFYLTEGSQ